MSVTPVLSCSCLKNKSCSYCLLRSSVGQVLYWELLTCGSSHHGKKASDCKVSCEGSLLVRLWIQLLKNLEPYIAQGLSKVDQLKREQQQSKEGLEAMIFSYRWASLWLRDLSLASPLACLASVHTQLVCIKSRMTFRLCCHRFYTS